MSDQLSLFEERGERLFPAAAVTERVRRRKLHRNSMDAYHARGAGRSRSKRTRLIVDYLRVAGPSTDRQVMRGLELPDMNAVRPRITEAIDAGFLREVDSVRCDVTGRPVRVVEVAR